jgi:hypothetical protein
MQQTIELDVFMFYGTVCTFKTISQKYSLRIGNVSIDTSSFLMLN